MDEAISYIASDSRSAGAAQLERILSGAESLAQLPDRGRMVPELGDPRFRELILPPFRLIYLRSQDHVWVVALIHTSQEFRSRAADLHP